MAKKVLIVEDNDKNRLLITDVLKYHGYDVIEATNGKEGIRMAKESMPDLIIMDIQMPVMDGIEAMKVLKSNPETKDIPVITLTSYAMEEDRERFMREGFDGYILKPINVKGFSEEVKKYIKP